MSATPLTASEIVALHPKLIAEFGGDAIERVDAARSCVESSQNNALIGASYLGSSEIDPMHVAALLLVYLTLAHCFVDGNKRVAWTACVEHLLRYGIAIQASPDEAVTLVYDIEAKRVDRDGVIRWFAMKDRLGPAPSIQVNS